MPNEQGYPQILFKLPDLHAESGLSNVKLLGRSGHIAGIYHAHKIF